jgi:crotonobetainyl-CoA:carnitine CoA-transferase CaiB-like acyl-CoA transferase
LRQQEHTTAPLSGLKVLDLTRVLAGPLCTMMLGDLGADVIKVERPGEGDETRGWGPPFGDDGESAYYRSINRNKLSVTADLDDPADQALLKSLAGQADVVVENFRPGTLEGRGLGAELFLRQRPSIVWCTITGFGLESDRPGYDFVVQAESGWMGITGEPGGDPMKVGIALADVIAGKDAAIAILAALAGVGRGRPGGRVEISLARSANAALVNVAQNAMVSGDAPARWGNAHPNLVPYQLFRASDTVLVIAVGSDAQWTRCADALGLHDLAGDPALRTNAGRVARRSEVVAAMSARLATATAAEWRERLEAVGVPTGAVRSVLEVVTEAGGSPLHGMPSAVGGAVRFPPPRLDEHGGAIRRHGWEAFKSGGSGGAA